MAKPAIKTPAITSKGNPSLREIVDRTAVMAKTRRLDISFNELLDMYQADPTELEIRPEFQRVFVWSDIQQSRFIESLLLELPIPPIYVVEDNEESHYLLIDGLQRMSSYLHFRGFLENTYRNIKKGDFLTLKGCDIIKELDGKKWVDLDSALQIRLKRSFVTLQVIRKESQPDLRYHMFKRLNSGGTQISEQQIRNASFRMLPEGNRIMEFMENMVSHPSFISTCSNVLTKRDRDRQKEVGYALRFFAFKNRRNAFVHDVDPFIDRFVELVSGAASPPIFFDYLLEEATFKKTFDILFNSTGDKSFTFATATGNLSRGFSANHFEGVTLGIQDSINELDPHNTNQMLHLKSALEGARVSEEFKDATKGGGNNTPKQLRARITIITNAVKSILK